MRHLITGGAGFIGSHLAEELIGRGETVHVLDDLSTGSLNNIRHLQDHPRFECTIGSAECHEVVRDLVDATDLVHHLAAAVGVELVVASPAKTIATNVHCTEVVLAEAARDRKPVFLASTSEVYGKSEKLPFREDGDLVMGPPSRGRWAYACSKAIDEFLALAYHQEHRVPVVIGRLFNTAGARQTGRYGMVVPSFVGQALAGAPITVHGDGRQRRCFSHVHDVVRAILTLMDDEASYGEIYNIGATSEISIRELAVRVLEATGSSSELRFVPYAEAYGKGFEDMYRRIPDTTKITDATGWRPIRDVAMIIDDVVRDQQEQALEDPVPSPAGPPWPETSVPVGAEPA